MAKKVTLENLAAMLKHGFDETSKRADVDRQFAGVETRFTGIENRFNGIERQFGDVNNQFEGLHVRLDRIEKLILADHRQRIEHLESEVRTLKKLVAAVA